MREEKVGIKSEPVYCDADNPTEVLLWFETADAARAREVIQSDDVKAAMKEAGAVGPPKIHVIPQRAQEHSGGDRTMISAQSRMADFVARVAAAESLSEIDNSFALFVLRQRALAARHGGQEPDREDWKEQPRPSPS